MTIRDKLVGWIAGPPEIRDDGVLAVVRLRNDVEIDGQLLDGLPIIVSRWMTEMRMTGLGYRIEYDDAIEHIDIDKEKL